MPSTFNKNTFESTYRDDYSDSDNFYRILFNSGRALQARELTQSQTIIQKEIERFGGYIFKDGAVVKPGGYTIKSDYQYIALDETGGVLLPAEKEALVGLELTGDTSGLICEVIEVVSDTEKGTVIYVNYTNTSNAGGSSIPAMSLGEVLNATGGFSKTLKVKSASDSVGVGTKVYVSEGIFFVRGHFVFCEKQELFLSLFSNSGVNAIVGFKVVEDIITEADDDSLYDNQGVVPNRTSPGAHRYRIRLILTTKDAVADSETFIFFSEIFNNTTVEEVQKEDSLAKILDVLATRTKEESGDYVLQPFRVSFDNDSDSNYLSAIVEPGVAYVNGYRAAHTNPTPIRIEKPRGVQYFRQEDFNVDYGNYIVVSSSNTGGLPQPYKLLYIYNDPSAGSIIGRCRVKSYSKSGSELRAHLFDIKMNSGQVFNTAARLQDATSATYILKLATVGELNDVNNNTSFIELNAPRPHSFIPSQIVVQRYIATSTGGTTIVMATLSTDEIYTDASDWSVMKTDGTLVAASVVINTQNATISGLTAGDYTISYYVQKQFGASQTQKVEQTNYVGSGTVAQDSDSNWVVRTGKTDVFKIRSIWVGNADSANVNASSVLSNFTLDGGQKDNYFGESRLIRNSGSSVTGTVYFKCDYFSHGATGDYFNFLSYGPGGSSNYDKIGSYRQQNGQTYDLRSVIDFRSVIDPSSKTFTAGSAVYHETPKRGSTIVADTEYYNSRIDKLVIDTKGNIQFITGDSSQNPFAPASPENTLALYDVTYAPYTVNASELKLDIKKHKRYTMRDISVIEDRLSKLEEVTSLSLLEAETDALVYTDELGAIRPKTGYVADSFRDGRHSDTTDPDYRATVGTFAESKIRPMASDDNIAMLFDASMSSGYKIAGDNIYINYTDTGFITQDVISGYESVNPYAVSSKEGNIELSPASDFWYDNRRLADVVIDGGLNVDVYRDQALLWNSHQWNWQGTDPSSVQPGDVVESSTSRELGYNSAGRRIQRITTQTERVVSNEIIRTVVGEKSVDAAVVPWCRTQKIYFKANGLKANRQYFPFFQGRSVSQWCKQEEYKTRLQRIQDGEVVDFGNTYRDLSVTSHPWGTTELYSNSYGELTGSFFLPNTGPTYENWVAYQGALLENPSAEAAQETVGTYFKTGNIEFKLTDVNTNDDNNSLSLARAFYTASGLLNIKQKTVKSTRNIRVESSRTSRTVFFDPLAQTFLVNQKYAGGVFVTGGSIYVRDIPATATDNLIVELREVENGIPLSNPIPGAVVSIRKNDVVVPSNKYDLTIVRSSPTTFTFSEPVYLSPNTSYALVVLSNSPEYTVYIAETEQFELGSTTKRISKQAHAGSLLKSQNGSTWTPVQSQDLAFNLNIAEFANSASVVFGNADVPYYNMEESSLIHFENGSNVVNVKHQAHGLSVGDTVRFSNNPKSFDSATTYGGILTGVQLMDSDWPIIASDGMQYQFQLPQNATKTQDVGSLATSIQRNINYDLINPVVTTLIPSDLNIVKVGIKQTKGFSWSQADDASITNKWNRDASYNFTLRNGENNYIESQPNCVFSYANTDNIKENGVTTTDNYSLLYKVELNTQDAYTAPYIDTQRVFATLVNNIIDNQDSAVSGGGFNVPVNYVAETEPSGGSSLSKYIMKPVTLESSSAGLKILMGASRPRYTELEMYYRIAGADENIRAKGWTLIQPTVNPAYSDPSPNIAKTRADFEYELANVDFFQYQVKVVMKSSVSVTVPEIYDIRAIALAV